MGSASPVDRESKAHSRCASRTAAPGWTQGSSTLLHDRDRGAGRCTCAPSDGRGNRTVVSFGQVPTSGDVEGQLGTLTADALTRLAPARVSTATATEVSGTRGVRTFTFDENGRMATETTSNDYGGTPNATTTFTFPYGGAAVNGGVDSVIRAVNVNGLVFNYLYDSRNCRTRKQHPAPGAVEDFFYDSAGVMLSERSFTFTVNSEGNTVDEYISLAGMPVAMVRSVFDGAHRRLERLQRRPGRHRLPAPRRECAVRHLLPHR